MTKTLQPRPTQRSRNEWKAIEAQKGHQRKSVPLCR